MIDTSCGARALHGEKKEEQAVRFLDRVRNALMRFMYGRYGHDQLNRALCVLILALYLISLPLSLIPMVGSALRFLNSFLWFFVLLRMLSRDIPRRRSENEWFLSKVGPAKQKLRDMKLRRQDTAHKYFTCKNCSAVCRVPRGRGKIIITCPRCGREIHGKS